MLMGHLFKKLRKTEGYPNGDKRLGYCTGGAQTKSYSGRCVGSGHEELETPGRCLGQGGQGKKI